MKGKINIASVLSTSRKFLFWLSTAVVTILLGFILLIQVPYIQNYIKDQILISINEATGQSIRLKNIQVKWFDQVLLKGLQVEDYKGNLLLQAKGIEINYNLSNLLEENHLFLDNVNINKGELNLVNYEDSMAINILEFIKVVKSINRQPQQLDSLKEPLKISVTQVELEEVKVKLDNQTRQPMPDQYLDFSHFDFMISQAGFYQLDIKKDTISTIVSYLIGEEENTRFSVREFQSFFRLTNKNLTLDEFFLKTPNSKLGDSFVFSYDAIDDLSYLTSKVFLDCQLEESEIDQYDLSYFANVPREHHMIHVNTKVRGTIPDLSIRDLSLKYNEHSTIKGNLDFLGLPEIKEAFIDADISEGFLYPEDFSRYLGEFKTNLRSLGRIRFSGSFLGFINDFVANADFVTDNGRIQSDINLKFPKGIAEAKYSGKLVLDRFNAGAFINKPDLIQKVNLNGEIDGQGLNVNNANFKLNADITNTGIMGYKYAYIKANGRFAASYFQGILQVDDPHCKIDGVGTLNLGIVPEEIEVRGFVNQLDFKPLGLSEHDITLKTAIYSNFTGLNIDSLIGKIQLDSMYVRYEDRSILFDTVSIAAQRDRDSRKIYIDLKEAQLKLDGDFYFSQLVSDADIIAREFAAYFEPELEKRVNIYERLKDTRNYQVDLTLNYQNINPYIAFFNQELELSPGGTVEGKYYQRKNATLFLFSEIDSVRYQGVTFYDNTIDINASKDMDSLGVIANLYVHSASQKWRKIPETRDMSIEAIWFNNNVTIQGHVDQPDNNSSALINAELTLLRDKLVFNFKPSNMVAFGERWFFNPYNKIEIASDAITVDKLELYKGEQSVSLKGLYSASRQTDLLLDFKQFDLKSISPVLPVSLGGVLSSQVILKRDREEESFQLLSEINLKELVIDDLLVGNINGSSDWVKGLQALAMDFVVQRESIRTITMEGFYYPYKEVNQLDIGVDFDQANVKLLEPLLNSLFSDIEGSASGSVKLTGSLGYPILNGSSSIENGKFKFNYLGTNYQFNGDIDFNNENILMKGIQISDRDGDRANLTGRINHKGFKNFALNLGITANNFLFLNTTASESELYYGSAKGTGDIKVTGPTSDLLIKANVTTESGTKVYIPLETGTDIDQKDYISFVDLSDSTRNEVTKEQIRNSVSGIRLDFDLNITNDAYLELIRNLKTGDIIRGRGSGNLNMSLDTQGDFQLFGEITISEGGYNFTIPNFINKEFDVSPGSTISWYGDPYQGILNLTAVYRQMASLGDYTIQQSSTSENVPIVKRYPFLVILNLEGEMLSPEIDFQIKVDESTVQLETNDQVMLATINNNEQELKRQVFSLLILRKFSVQDGFSIGGGAVGSSLSEFLSNQFSYFISQVDENLEVDVDLSTFSDANAFNTFQLRLAYTFLDGRLRVSGGGLVSQSSNTDSDNFFGDWSVRYTLTKDGHLRIKAFSHTKQRAATRTSTNFFRETGVSFQYVNSFNEFNDLLKKSRDQAVKGAVSPSVEPSPSDTLNTSVRL